MSVPYTVSGVRPAGLDRVRVTVLGVAADGTAQCRDQLGKERRIRYDARPKATAPPAAGEMWDAVQVGTTWYLDRLLNHPAPPVITGSRASSAATLAALLAALDAAGLIDDRTTA